MTPNTLKPAGFTLVEVLVAMAITAILASLAVPGFQHLIQNNRSTAATNDLVAAINVARSEAVKQGVAVSVCPLESTWWDGETGGWFVERTGTCDSDPSDAMRVWEELPHATRINANLHNTDQITFGTLGERISGGRANSGRPMFRIEAVSCNGSVTRGLDIGASGLLSLSRSRCDS